MLWLLIIAYCRLAEYGLDAENDAVANYMILSLQTDQMSPAINVRPKYFSLHSRYFHPSPRKARLTTRRWRLWSRPRWRGTASPTCSCWGAWPSPATSSSSSSGRRGWEGLITPPAFISRQGLMDNGTHLFLFQDIRFTPITLVNGYFPVSTLVVSVFRTWLNSDDRPL